MKLGVVLILAGIALVVGSFVVPVPISSATQFLMMGAGLLMLLAGVVVAVLFTLYQKTSADEAIVRTGYGGNKVIVDGGTLFIPVMHRMLRVPLQTMRLDCIRENEEALITQDMLRADLKAEFYIKVKADRDNIVQAARSLGERSVNADSVKELVFDKLVSALRTVAANRSLNELNTKRNEFAEEVQQILSEDLQHNGLTLETVTISKIDQTDSRFLNQNNVFDAQGLKRMTEITQTALVAKNQLERDAEMSLAAKNVSTRKEILKLELDQQTAEAGQAAEVAMARASKTREAQEFDIAQRQQVETRAVEKDRAVKEAQIQAQKKLIEEQQIQDVATVLKSQAVDLAERKRRQTLVAAEEAIQVADVNRTKAVEVATRQQAIEVAQKETERANAEAGRLSAEAEREKQNQNVKTVETTQTAEREKAKAIIEAQALAEQQRVEEQMKADVQAYSAVKAAEGQQKAAEMSYHAQLRLADASAAAATKRAEGDLAAQMVAVNVGKEQVVINRAAKMIEVDIAREAVNVDAARVQVAEKQVEVDRRSLENKEKFGKAGIDLQIQLRRIEAEEKVGTAMAQSIGTFMSHGEFKVFATPEMMTDMMTRFSKGLGLGQFLDGVNRGTNGGVDKLAAQGGQLLGEMVQKLAATKEPPAPGGKKDPAA